SYDGVVPDAGVSLAMKESVVGLYSKVGVRIEAGHVKEAIEMIFNFIRQANKYFDDEKPWIQIKKDEAACARTMATCVYIIANLAQLLSPFLPFSSEEVGRMLGVMKFEWREIQIGGRTLLDVKPLFERIDVGQIGVELERLKEQSVGVK